MKYEYSLTFLIIPIFILHEISVGLTPFTFEVGVMLAMTFIDSYLWQKTLHIEWSVHAKLRSSKRFFVLVKLLII